MRMTIVIAVFLFIVLVKDTDAWRRRRRRRSSPDPPPPDTTAPTIYNCPQNRGNQYTTTSTAVVTWTEPTCSDASGCSLSRSGPPSGSQFSEGFHRITYTARDGVGNTRTCDITFTVIVIRCSSLPAPAHCTVTCSLSNSVGSVCMYTCHAGYTITSGSSQRICQASGNSASWSGTEPTCSDIQPPTFIDCPSDISTHADKNIDSTTVTWTVTATDNDGATPTVTCGPASGSVFVAGDHSVTCEATDQSGNKNQCNFNVAVEVLHCPDLQSPFLVPPNQSCDTQYGSQCYFVCDSGYDLIGSNETTCEFDGTDPYWSEDLHCEMIGCLSFTLPQGVDVYPESCAEDYKVPPRTVCNFYCQYQLTLVGDGAPATCDDEDIAWDRAVNTSSLACLDKMAPTISDCPSTMTANRTQYWGVEVTFTTPTASDNYDAVLDSWTSPDDLRTPYNFTTDMTCEYHFQDDAENTASCIFNVILHDTVVPECLYCPPSQSMRSSLEMTPVTWDEPVFRDIPGNDVLVTCNYGSNNMMLPWGDNHIVYTATNLKNGLSTVCDFFIKIEPMPCMSLRRPAHGAIACDGWEYGRYCSMSCSEDYDIPAPSPFQAPTDLYVCGSSGQWSPHSYVPDCSHVRDPKKNNLPSDLLYYSGQCGSPDTMNKIAQSFIQTINKSIFRDICYMEDGCTVDNVAVSCGWPTRRRKRALIARRKRSADLGDKMWDGIQEWGEYIGADEGTVEGLYQLKLSMVLGINVTESTQEALKKLTHLTREIQKNMMSENVLGHASAEGQDREDPIHSYILLGDDVLDCPDGFVADHDNLNCVACTTGHRYDNNTKECRKCDYGFYQPEYAQADCKPCPDGQSTVERGSRNLDECRDQCAKGHFSTFGFVPCIQCPLDTFQPLIGQRQCFECPDGKKTTARGASDVNQCE